MLNNPPSYAPDDPAAADCYRSAMRALRVKGIEYLVGGAYALGRYAGIIRHTKDLDVFLRARDRDRALAALKSIGHYTEITYDHWLAKSFCGPYFIDLIYSSGNGLVAVDNDWFSHAVPAQVVGEKVLLCPVEELVWSKAFIMERNRYDGADIMHVLRAQAHRLDWTRLLSRFGPHWRVLYSHLILFGFVYPAERNRLPLWILRKLHRRFHAELKTVPPSAQVCQGTLLAAAQYLPDINDWGYDDARLMPQGGSMTPAQVAEWTDGVLTGR